MADEQEILNRWRLVLGKYASEQISFSGGGLNYMDMENVLDSCWTISIPGNTGRSRRYARTGREAARVPNSPCRAGCTR